MREFDKCNFCTSHGENFKVLKLCCICEERRKFTVDENKIFEKAKEKGISIADVVALMKAED